MFKILVNADSTPDFQAVATLLKGRGYDLEEIDLEDSLHESEAGETDDVVRNVFEKTRALHPDLVLLTPNLPANSGFNVCRKLKNHPQTESIPVVFLSCSDNKQPKMQQTVEGFECGANDVIHKSAAGNVDELIARINAAIRTKMSLSKSRALADQLNQMNSELYERNLAIEKELYTTRQLQQSLLPPILPDPAPNKEEKSLVSETTGQEQHRFSKCHFRNDNLMISGVYLPCDALGGDLYDVIQFADKSIGVSISDVSGHGVPAAFVTAIFKASFYRTTHSFTRPDEVMHHLNNELMNIIKTGQYVTAVYTRLYEIENEPGHYRLQFSGAGHPYPIYYSAEQKKVIRLQENGTPLAWFGGMEYTMGEIVLQKGDKVLLFSDGISEMKNVHGDMFGEEALEAALERIIKNSGGDNPMDILMTELSDFTQGHPLDDDVSLVIIEAT